jgi:ribosomal protein L31
MSTKKLSAVELNCHPNYTGKCKIEGLWAKLETLSSKYRSKKGSSSRVPASQV